MPKTLILCDCLKSQTIDSVSLSEATGLTCSKLHTGLCTTQVEDAARAITTGDAIICCTQEQRFFESLADEVDAPMPAFLDLRDRAGWSADTASKLPKMAALAAEAALPAPAPRSIDVQSEGLCLIIGSGDVALSAAAQLADHLAVTLLLDDASPPPDARNFDVIYGHLRKATGSLGRFDVTIDALRELRRGGRGAFQPTEPQDGGRSACDIIVDLSGQPPLFPAPEKRDGYLRADPRSAPAVAEAILNASHMTGTFEKPLYVRMEPILCAHSRAGKIGCSNCLDACPTGAISPAGEHVTIDPNICAGCGACSALCPSGAITYEAPSGSLTMRRIQTLAQAYRDAGGTSPRLLVHDDDFGTQMISLCARHGKGLPANVIPLEVAALSGFGHAEILAALASGFAGVTLLLAPRTERDAINTEIPLARAIAGQDTGQDRVSILDITDPDMLGELLFDAPTLTPSVTDPVLAMGNRRQITRLSAKALHPGIDHLPLPDDAPYGAVLVDTDACTLCQSCVSLCPSGALGDNPDLPQLRFQEDACLQCGLCANICPEDAITYAPRLNLTDTALEQTILNEEEPFACIECGTLFGVKSTVEKITEKLAGKHSMFANPKAAKMIQMCDNCRVNAQFHSKDSPLSGEERPRPRTTDDYLSKRRDH